MSKVKVDTYTRSRLEILSYIVSFSTMKVYDGELMRLVDDKCALRNTVAAPIGSLVVITSVPMATKWYLGWLEETKPNGQYLIRSIEDGELCWWENVGIYHFPLALTEDKDYWRWTDAQFEFKDKWFRACKDFYITIPVYPKFNGDGSVTLSTRKRFGMGTPAPSKTFPNWKKLKSSEMAAYFKSCDKR